MSWPFSPGITSVLLGWALRKWNPESWQQPGELESPLAGLVLGCGTEKGSLLTASSSPLGVLKLYLEEESCFIFRVVADGSSLLLIFMLCHL